MLLAVVAMVGVAYGLAAIVLLIKEANFFVDATNYLFAIASGVAFPITLLPGVLQPIAYALPTTYAMDILRQHALGTRPLLTRVGGSIPLMPALTEKGIDTILTGFGLPESNIHSPNERFLVPYFAAGIDTAAALFTALGRLND
jgi:acetylornithine deacetylase/succinyl-diaminopimelate desuccinylase-like protein